MIRDPSDGSVRQTNMHDAPTGPSVGSGSPLESGNKVTYGPECVGRPDARTAHADTGLPPEPKKPKDIAKLERSRLWLKSYKERK